MELCCKFCQKTIFYLKVERDISQTCLFLVLVGKTALFAAKISSSVKVANKTAVAWIFLRVNWRAWIFFSFTFPLRECFVCTSPPPPISFLMVRPLIKTGTVLIWYISSFLYSNVTLLDIRIETFDGSLIRQWEVNSIHQLFFFRSLSVTLQAHFSYILWQWCGEK